MSSKDRDHKKVDEASEVPPLKEGEDFYVENGLYVFTAKYLLARGYCCNNGCRHCPYKPSDSGSNR